MVKGPELLILAGGMGSRYQGLKQLDQFGPNGESLMEYSLFDAKRAGFSKVIFLIRKEVEGLLVEKIIKPYHGLIEMDIAYQDVTDLPLSFAAPKDRTKPWGTGHAVWAARSKITQPFAVINADDFYSPDAFTQLSTFLQNTSKKSLTFGLVAYHLGGTLSDHGSVNRGLVKRNQGLLASVEEKTGIFAKDGQLVSDDLESELTLDDLVSVNCWAFSLQVFELLEVEFKAFLTREGQELKSEFFLPDVVDAGVRSERLQVEVMASKAKWMGVTYPSDKALVVKDLEALHSSGVYPEKLMNL